MLESGENALTQQVPLSEYVTYIYTLGTSVCTRGQTPALHWKLVLRTTSQLSKMKHTVTGTYVCVVIQQHHNVTIMPLLTFRSARYPRYKEVQ